MFTFSLQTLLDYRKQREEARQVELAEARRALTDEEAKMLRILEDERANLAELNRVADEASPVSLVASLLFRGQRLADQRRKQEQVIEAAQIFQEECRERLAEAMQEKEMLEKLKEKKMKAHLAEEARRETKATDEAGRMAARYRGKS